MQLKSQVSSAHGDTDIRGQGIWEIQLMNTTYRVGDLVILQHSTFYPEHNGDAALIVGGYGPRLAVDMRTMKGRTLGTYKVQILREPNTLDSCDGTVLVLPHQIRKLGPGEIAASTQADDVIGETLPC